jgi:succinate dehydrogenase / fumarate reductase, cytochrome b subunit
MVALVFVHLFVMHYAAAPSSTTSAFVAVRWAASGWRAFDGVLLLLALTHGVVGVRGMVRDALRSPRARAALDAGAAAVSVVFSALGIAAIVAASPPLRPGPPAGAGDEWIPGVLIAALLAAATATYVALAAAIAALGWRLARGEPLGRWNYAGQWAFALNRTAGAGVLAFLLVHVVDVALFPFAPSLYDRTIAAYAMPYLLPMEWGLVAAVVYHALDGLRLMTLEALDRRGAALGTPTFVALLVLTVSLSLPALAVLLGWRP